MPMNSSVVVCIKWAPPQTPSDAASDDRFAGVSPADQAAIELALRTGEACGDEVVAISVGPAGADKILREALSCGATRAIRVDAPEESASADAAAAAARAIGTLDGVRLVWCGDYSPDRGSGSFPAFLAARLGLDQVLGLVRVEFPASGGLPLEVVRRLDGGRRERSIVHSAAVLSVEGSLARLRRASLARTLAARTLDIDVISAGIEPVEPNPTRPFRPRARTISAPSGDSPLDRIRAVTETATPKGSSDPIALEPAEAATLILTRLREWGYTQ